MNSRATKRATLLFGHADMNGSTPTLNQSLADGYTRGFESVDGSVERFDLAQLDFDPVMRAGYRAPQTLEPDLLRVRRSIEQSSHVIWVFPTYWASPPALVRGLFDRLFLPGWAFRYEKGNPLPVGLLKGRSTRVLLTMDAPWWWYTFVNQRCIHRSFGGGSLAFCGFDPVRFTTVHSARTLSTAARAAWVERITRIGAQDAVRTSASTPQLQPQLDI